MPHLRTSDWQTDSLRVPTDGDYDHDIVVTRAGVELTDSDAQKVKDAAGELVEEIAEADVVSPAAFNPTAIPTPPAVTETPAPTTETQES